MLDFIADYYKFFVFGGLISLIIALSIYAYYTNSYGRDRREDTNKIVKKDGDRWSL